MAICPAFAGQSVLQVLNTAPPASDEGSDEDIGGRSIRRGTRKAIKALEGKDIEDVSEYLDYDSPKYKKMVEWIARDLEATTLRYQTIDDMVKAVGLAKEKLCLYCWNGEYPKSKDVESQEKVDTVAVR